MEVQKTSTTAATKYKVQMDVRMIKTSITALTRVNFKIRATLVEYLEQERIIMQTFQAQLML